MITLQNVYYEIQDELSKNEKLHNSFIKYFNWLEPSRKEKISVQNPDSTANQNNSVINSYVNSL